jgi:DNA replication and repair protein RecF
VRVEQLRLHQFRLFEAAELELGPGLNLITGGNGAGKTSLLEALHLLAYGRSFRGAVRDGLIRRGAAALDLYAEVVSPDERRRRLGLRRGLRDWEARIDGQGVAALSDLYREIAVVSFEPGSHELIAGGSEHRRRYLDWFLFHVEPDFLPVWRRHQRALRQRNVLLKAHAPDPGQLDAWDAELAEAGERLTAQREHWLGPLQARIVTIAADLLPELGPLGLRFQRGWGEGDLAGALRNSRNRDLVVGHSTLGPHRADWGLGYERLPQREMFSRGQEKLTALACLLAQAEALAATRQGDWPILCLDDLGSELDRTHLGWALDWLRSRPAQWLLTGTERPPEAPDTGRVFHVEQGLIRRLL